MHNACNFSFLFFVSVNVTVPFSFLLLSAFPASLPICIASISAFLCVCVSVFPIGQVSWVWFNRKVCVVYYILLMVYLITILLAVIMCWVVVVVLYVVIFIPLPAVSFRLFLDVQKETFLSRRHIKNCQNSHLFVLHWWFFAHFIPSLPRIQLEALASCQ